MGDMLVHSGTIEGEHLTAAGRLVSLQRIGRGEKVVMTVQRQAQRRLDMRHVTRLHFNDSFM